MRQQSDGDLCGDNIKMQLLDVRVYLIYCSTFSVRRNKWRAAEGKIKKLPVAQAVWNCRNKQKNAIFYRRICSIVVSS